MFNANFRLAALDRSAYFTVQLFASATPSANALIWIAAASMFLLVAIVLFQSLRTSKFVEGGGRVAVSILIALLSVIGLFSGTGWRSGHSTVRDPQSEFNTTVNFILVPYAALALTIAAVLIMLMLMLGVRVCRRGCARLHVWRQRFGRLKTKGRGIVRGRGASMDGRLSHGDQSSQSTGSAENDN